MAEQRSGQFSPMSFFHILFELEKLSSSGKFENLLFVGNVLKKAREKERQELLTLVHFMHLNLEGFQIKIYPNRVTIRTKPNNEGEEWKRFASLRKSNSLLTSLKEAMIKAGVSLETSAGSRDITTNKIDPVTQTLCKVPEKVWKVIKPLVNDAKANERFMQPLKQSDK